MFPGIFNQRSPAALAATVLGESARIQLSTVSGRIVAKGAADDVHRKIPPERDSVKCR